VPAGTVAFIWLVEFDPAVSVATGVVPPLSNVITGTLPVGNVPANVTSPPAATGDVNCVMTAVTWPKAPIEKKGVVLNL